jgi:hypothetical protein
MSKIEQQVMASVGVIYTARSLSATALKLYALVASVYAWDFGVGCACGGELLRG